LSHRICGCLDAGSDDDDYSTNKHSPPPSPSILQTAVSANGNG
jgi:hypothetical protein